ncbi:MAG TPA: acyl-CoA thioesterase, partial [Candidatus Polarisedimenticolia bacterium]|nr:acyl-CoA thioesterase [Candidatus Polarisedimenticolia bacterium]
SRDPKPASASRVTMTEIVNPEDTNPHGNIFGGRVMALIDKAAAVVGLRHARNPIVTASVDSLVFHHPIRLGSIVVIEARLNAVFQSSMEVEVLVESEEILTGERRRTTTAYVTLVAVDGKGHPTPAPPLQLQSDEDRRRVEEASRRRSQRLQARSTESA